MKHLILALFTSAAIAVSAANESTVTSTNDITVTANETVVTANATLKDGSTVKGEFLTQKITGSTIFLKKLALDPSIVKSISFPGTNNAAKIELENGDKFTMKVHNKTFPFASILGELNVQRKNIRSLTLTKRRTASKGDEAGLVFHCTFDDEAAITSPAVGPKGTVCSRDFVAGKVNGAVHVPTGSSAGFFNLPPETFGKEGCIEFWAKIEPRREFYRDCDPRMIFIKSPAGWFTVEYSSNNGGGRGGFCVRCFGFEYIKGGSFGGGYKYADVIPDVSAWHHYAFSWTETDLTIYIDGNALKGAFKTGDGRINEDKLKGSTSVMGLPNSNANPYNTEPNSAFSIDELKIWNHAKQEFGI
ncbi:MAG: hypothetical protein II863_18585 [Kiritimatiellae bacterium]|nr:hypothetical protein [Kiritimatiellia bacterium]